MWSLPQSPPASRPHISIITNVGGLFSSSNKDGIIHELDISRKEKPCKWEAVKVVWKVYQLDGLEKACSSTLITRRNEALSWHNSKQRGYFSVIFSSLSLSLHQATVNIVSPQFETFILSAIYFPDSTCNHLKRFATLHNFRLYRTELSKYACLLFLFQHFKILSNINLLVSAQQQNDNFTANR